LTNKDGRAIIKAKIRDREIYQIFAAASQRPEVSETKAFTGTSGT
jgi:hypothetical protein